MSQDLLDAALRAMKNAHAPYSGFPVGAALRTDTGMIYSGCNVENASYPEGWCAETSALAAMVSAGDTVWTEVAVVAERMPRITPCGGCRQRLSEFAASDAVLHLCTLKRVVDTIPFRKLLPDAFASAWN